MSNLPTYSPDSALIKVGGVKISGLAEQFLSRASNLGFVLTLHAGSESLNYMLGLTEGIETDVSIWTDITHKDGSHNSLFDIEGAFILTGRSFKLGVNWPEIEFHFVHNSVLSSQKKNTELSK